MFRRVLEKPLRRIGATKKAYFASFEKDAQPLTTKVLNILDKHFGTIGVIMTSLVTSYTAIHISDSYFSYIPGSDAEKKRLDKERLKEESKTLGKWEGFWTFWFPLTKEKEDVDKTK